MVQLSAIMEDFVNLTEQPPWYDPDYPDRPPPPAGPPPDHPPGSPDTTPTTIHFVAVGIILPLGIFFNILAFIVFATSRTLRKTTTAQYLLALSIADCLYLIGELIRWMNTPDMAYLNWYVDFIEKNNALCKLTMSLRYINILASAWLTVVITVERFISVRFPTKVKKWSTLKIAKITICMIFLISTMGGSFPMWTVGLIMNTKNNMTFCGVQNNKLYDVYNWIFLRSMSLIIPGVFIVVFCALIIYNLNQASKMRRQSLHSARGGGGKAKGRERALQKQLTMMLLAVAITFVLLRLPYTITYYIHYAYQTEMFATEMSDTVKMNITHAAKVTDIFVALNYASNFFLYCFCGKAFRKELKKLFHCKLGEKWRSDLSFSGIARGISTRSNMSKKPVTPRPGSHISQPIYPPIRSNMTDSSYL